MFHANGWTFMWTITAIGGAHICIRKVQPTTVLPLITEGSVTLFCAAPTVLIGLCTASDELREGVHVTCGCLRRARRPRPPLSSV
jgi:fatty-acyl-CoA synthase